MTEEPSLINWILGVCLTVIGFFLRGVHSDTKATDTKVQNLSEHVANNYVKKEDYKDEMREIKDMFKHIMDKLDAKADK